MRMYLNRYLLILFALTASSANLAHATPANKPKVLIYSAVDIQYVADSLPFWGNNVGVNGFILSYLADWSTSKTVLFRNVDLLKKINAQGKDYDIDSNFINVALGNGELPLWTDDKAWSVVIDDFKNIAEFAKQTGTKGIALDTEPYTVPLFAPDAARFKSVDRARMKAKTYQRGQEIMQALVKVYPDIEIIILPEGAYYWFNPDQGSNAAAFELWIDFYNGLASVKNNKGIIVATERTYDVTNKFSLSKISTLLEETMLENVADPVFWKDHCSIALGMWPLGKEYDNKASKLSPSEFKRQFTQAVALSPKYVWVYDHGSSWFQLTTGDVEKYTQGGRNIWGRDYQKLPTDPHIDDYYSVLREYKKSP